MKTPKVLDYQRSIPPAPRRRHDTFGVSMALCIVQLLMSVALSDLMRSASNSVRSNYATRNGEAELALFFLGVPIFGVMLFITLITIVLATGKNAKPWSRAERAAVFSPQVISVLLPVVLVMAGVHA